MLDVCNAGAILIASWPGGLVVFFFFQLSRLKPSQIYIGKIIERTLNESNCKYITVEVLKFLVIDFFKICYKSMKFIEYVKKGIS